ncbi:MAG: pentapeptide repeat-containing protein, partial [Candidatus Dadabacteria bacterium]|nr:pentapeptide repeat-containing protein [Candidatus Dadabacteria bacterium]
ADLTGAILINAKLKNADLTAANLEGADLAGTRLANAAPGALVSPNGASSLVSVSGIFDETPAVVQCDSPGAIAPGNGEDLEVTAACTVPAGTYHYRNVHIYNGGSLTFEDAVINFWAYNILIEKDSSLIAGTSAAPIGTAGGKLTIHLYGDDQGNGGSGVVCKTDVRCGVPEAIWTSEGASKVCLPPNEGGDPATCQPYDYFYHYHTLPVDTGDPNAYYGGTLNLFGKKGATLPDDLQNSNSGTSWARLNGTVNVGVTQLTVDRPVDWEVGDRIVVTTTDYLPANNEVLEIIAPVVSNTTFNFKVINAFTGVEIAGGLQHRHNGEPYPLTDVPIGNTLSVEGSPAAETRAAVALLTRSIRIVSAGDTFNSANPTCAYDCLSGSPANYHFGGHTSARQGFKQLQIQGVEFYQMGQGGRLGHYPVHFHMARETPSDTFVKDTTVWESMTRFMTIHATHGVLLARNVGFMSIGHGYYLEDGTEINNKLYSNLGILARAAVSTPQNPRQVPGILAWSGNPTAPLVPYNSDIFNPTIFWIMNGWNDFEYNMAVGATGCGVCYWLLSSANSGFSQG